VRRAKEATSWKEEEPFEGPKGEKMSANDKCGLLAALNVACTQCVCVPVFLLSPQTVANKS